MEKKGEMTTQQIVVLIILIASFIIILFFLFRLNFGKSNDKELCRNSIIARGSSILPSESFPVECSRSYLCITKDGTCESMTSPEIKIVKTKDEIYEVLANEMADCWWMFGEGEINYVGKDFKKNLYCSICSQIAFDDSIKKIKELEMGIISKRDFYEYLSKKEISSKQMSYLEYLTASKTFEEFEQNLKKDKIEFRNFDLNKQYFVFTGILSDVSEIGWVITSAVAVGAMTAGLVFSPVTGGTSAITAAKIIFIMVAATGGGIGGEYIGTSVQGGSGNEYLKPILIEAGSSEYEKFECKDIMTLS